MRLQNHRSILRPVCAAIVAVALLIPVGCGELGILLGLPVNRVILRNDGEFTVNAKVYISGEQDIASDVLTTIGEKVEFSIPPGETRSFERGCSDLRAIVVDEAKLDVLGGEGPTASTEVLRDGVDFNCRSTIEFAFDHSDLVFDFHITTSVREHTVFDAGGTQ